MYQQEFIIYMVRESVQCPYAMYKDIALSYDTTFLYTVVYSWIKLTPVELAKKVLMVKDFVKDP